MDKNGKEESPVYSFHFQKGDPLPVKRVMDVCGGHWYQVGCFMRKPPDIQRLPCWVTSSGKRVPRLIFHIDEV